ncbi:hypothetical protein [Streptomyces sp. H27-H5]|uniref:hypothetical protein n=1 Tax=Streptomyces sp. H27-H5 TaxID=2996460 RepID=UPI00226DC4C4|nr:hypothetical protein [Streptomyces sp. H27-H5]MCY0957747.1 hypothetical protein [Streptomyces sp. H27-H5]
MSVEVRLEPGRLARALKARGGFVERRLRARTERVAAVAAQLAPGSMGDGIETRIERVPKGLSGVITSTHPATRYVIEGTRPHVIRARRAKYLKFDVGGTTLFRKQVNHPGSQANDFLTKALLLGR